MAKVLILGGGFAAVAAAEEVRKQLPVEHDVTIVSANGQFTFYPAIVPMLFGEFAPEDIVFDLAEKAGERGIGCIEAEIRSIDVDARTVRITRNGSEEELAFSHLIIALGRKLATGSLPGFDKYAHHLMGMKAATKFRDAINEFQRGSLVVGLCPGSSLPVPVCEAALGLAERFSKEIESGLVSVTAVFPSTIEDAFDGSSLFRDIEGEFERKGVRLVTNFVIETVDANSLKSADGIVIAHDLLVLMPPFRGLGSVLEGSTVIDAAGFAKVNDLLQVDGRKGFYAAGDIVSLPGPRFGYMAIRQGKIAAQNVIAEIRGDEPVSTYEHRIAWAIGEKYTDPVFFHYGFWDESLEDHDPDTFFGMAEEIRQKYGPLKPDPLAAIESSVG